MYKEVELHLQQVIKITAIPRKTVLKQDLDLQVGDLLLIDFEMMYNTRGSRNIKIINTRNNLVKNTELDKLVKGLRVLEFEELNIALLTL